MTTESLTPGTRISTVIEVHTTTGTVVHTRTGTILEQSPANPNVYFVEWDGATTDANYLGRRSHAARDGMTLI